MKKLLLFAAFALSTLFGCADYREQPSLEGAWNSVTYSDNYYLFHGDGILEIHTLAGGQIIYEKWFAYDHNRETGTLDIRGRSGMYFEGSVSFNPSADTATMVQPGGLKIVLARW